MEVSYTHSFSCLVSFLTGQHVATSLFGSSMAKTGCRRCPLHGVTVFVWLLCCFWGVVTQINFNRWIIELHVLFSTFHSKLLNIQSCNKMWLKWVFFHDKNWFIQVSISKNSTGLGSGVGWVVRSLYESWMWPQCVYLDHFLFNIGCSEKCYGIHCSSTVLNIHDSIEGWILTAAIEFWALMTHRGWNFAPAVNHHCAIYQSFEWMKSGESSLRSLLVLLLPRGASMEGRRRCWRAWPRTWTRSRDVVACGEGIAAASASCMAAAAKQQVEIEKQKEVRKLFVHEDILRLYETRWSVFHPHQIWKTTPFDGSTYVQIPYRTRMFNIAGMGVIVSTSL